MGASRRFKRKRAREVWTGERKRFIREARRELSVKQAESERIAAQYQAQLDLERGVRECYAIGFLFAWLAHFGGVPGVQECTA